VQAALRSAVPLSGAQHEIAAGPYRAVAVGGGGGVRTLSHEGRDLLDGYRADALPDGARGQVLAPWPNRLRDGSWSYGGRGHRLPVDDVAGGHAIHGLVRWASWDAVLHTDRRVVLRHRLQARPGYPFPLDLLADHAVDARDGLTVELVARNPGTSAAPVALGMHPYLVAPDGGPVDRCALRLPARSRVLVDDQRLPCGVAAVEGTAYDLRRGPVLGTLVLDDAYTDLDADEHGRVSVRLTAPDGTATTLWTEGPVGWLQVFTGDTLAPGRRRRSVAVEPMTAPANALATGEGLVLLGPGEQLRLRWGVRAERAAPAPV